MRHYNIKIHKSQEESETAQQVKRQLSTDLSACNPKKISDKTTKIDIISEKPTDPNYRSGKNTLYIEPKQGETFHKCSTFNKEYVCCNVHVLKSVKNCPYDCSYCFLQNYLNNGVLSSVADIDGMIKEIQEKTKIQPWRFFRIGTWELGDSLALESLTHQARQLIKAFTAIPQAVLELRTKSDQVDSILDCDHQQRTIVAWSMNPKHIIQTQEHRTASIEKRLDAIQKVIKAGYLTAFHFDPMIYYDNWEQDYTELLDQLFAHVSGKHIAWISIGSLRFNPEMKQKMQENFPKTVLKHPEMICGPDKKVRYIKPIRKKMYTHLISELKKHLNTKNLSPTTTPTKNKPILYLCMERWDIWDACLGDHPTSIGHLDYLFAKSLEKRFPGMVKQAPNKKLYENESMGK